MKGGETVNYLPPWRGKACWKTSPELTSFSPYIGTTLWVKKRRLVRLLSALTPRIGTVECFTSSAHYGKLLNEHTGRSRCGLHTTEWYSLLGSKPPTNISEVTITFTTLVVRRCLLELRICSGESTHYRPFLDTNKQPLNPVRSGWARKLLSSGRFVLISIRKWNQD